MKHDLLKKNLLSVLIYFNLLSLLSFRAEAQGGRIEGNVIDLSTKSGVPGAVVEIQGTSFAQKTNEKGYFRIDNIPAGNYTITGRADGFGSDNLTLEIKPGGTYTLTFALQPAPQPLPEGILAGRVMMDDGNPADYAVVLIPALQKGSLTDENGNFRIEKIQPGTYTVIASTYEAKDSLQVNIQSGMNDSLQFVLKVPEFIGCYFGPPPTFIFSTRNNRIQPSTPSPVDVLRDELSDESNQGPGDVTALFHKITGLQVQRTSATLNSAEIRLQGLDGRYTQVLRDGFPLYQGYAAGLSLVQIPTADLHQVEVVKGASGTYYGNGALGGIVNFITESPIYNESKLTLNGSHLGGLDVIGCMSRMPHNAGFSLLAQASLQKPFDSNADGFADLPRISRWYIAPAFLLKWKEKNILSISSTLSGDTRRGGTMQLIQGADRDSALFYYQYSETNTLTTQAKYEHKLNHDHALTLKSSFSKVSRGMSLSAFPDDTMSLDGGSQISTWSEIGFNRKRTQYSLQTGLNFSSLNFREQQLTSGFVPRREDLLIAGAFASYQRDFGPKAVLETSLRGDYLFGQRFYLLPRIFLLYNVTDQLAMRIGGGTGYRAATMFNPEAEIRGYRDILEINRDSTFAETSYSGSFNLQYRTTLARTVEMKPSATLFFNCVNHPLLLSQKGSDWEFRNSDGYLRSAGGEAAVKFTIRRFAFWAGYTFTHATLVANGNQNNWPLTPRHSLKGELSYRAGIRWHFYIRNDFKSSQTLGTGTKTPAFITLGATVERKLGPIFIYVNVKNFTHVKQGNWGDLTSPPYFTPQFTEVFAPLEGRVIQAGIKFDWQGRD